MLITFYSFKGGVGRSMALVNVAEILADWGYNVILCDWDLEAPGLERYLTADAQAAADRAEAAASAAAEVAQYTARPGLMELLHEYKATMAEPPAEVESRAKREAGEDPSALDRSFKRVGKLYLRRPSTYAFPVSAQRPRQGSLRLLTAGRRDPSSYKAYAEAVRTFDWEEFYRKWAGASYIEFFREDLIDTARNGADIVLVDSRTGVTEHGGVATHHLADLVILLSAANEMNLEGTEWMARELSSPRLKETRGDRSLGVLPVPSRIEQTSQKDEVAIFRHRFAKLFGSYAHEVGAANAGKFYLDAEIPYIPYYSFYERVAAREGDTREQRLYAAYEFIARSVVAHGLRARLLAKRPDGARDIGLHEAGEGAAASRVRGKVYLSCSPADDDVASLLVRGLDAVGLSVWADTPAGDAQPPAEQAAFEAAGYLVLVGREGFDERAQAEFDYALRQQVLRKDCRLVPVIRGGVEQKNLPDDFLKLRPVTLPSEPSPDDGELFRRLAAELTAPAASGVFPDSGQPYVGPGYFEGVAARFFFGRDDEVRELVRNFGETPSGHVRWLQIEGANGCGKTSLARAGLIPAVQRGWLRGAPRRWVVVKTVADEDFIESLCVALGYAARQRLTPSEIQSMLSGPRGLREAVRKSTPAGYGFLLLVDGMEGLSEAGDGSRQTLVEFFESQLPPALKDPELPFYLVTTARSDAANAWLGQGKLRDTFERKARRFVAAATPRAGLREVVEGPAKLAGLNFEQGLVERVVADASEFRSPLAVLSPLLQRLWERRVGSTLTHQSYQELGGAGGVLRGGLEALVRRLDEEEQEHAKRILLRLVRVFDAGEGSMRSDASAPVPRAEVLGAAGTGEAALGVLSQLLSPPCPVVLCGGDGGALALAHGSLARQPPLRGWVEGEREELRLRDDLKASARLREVTLNPDPQLFARFNLNAEAFYASLPSVEKSRLTGILSRLVAYEPETGDVTTAKPIPLMSINEEDRPLVEKMHAAGMAEVREGTGPDGWDTLRAHEFLLPGWNRFRDWVKNSRQLLALRHSLTARASDWERYGQDPALLLRGAALVEARKLASEDAYISEAEADYVAASGLAERRGLERRVVVTVSLLFVVVLFAYGLYLLRNHLDDLSRDQEAAARALLITKNESNLHRARLYLALMSEGIGGDGSGRDAALALREVINLNSGTREQGADAEQRRKAADALSALEAGDIGRAREVLGDSPARMKK